MSKPKLRHIALSVDDPFATAEFYMKAFDMDKVGETDSPLARGVYLSDGTVNLAILNFKNDRWAGANGQAYRGIHHMGFHVDDLDKAEEKILAAGGTEFTGRPTHGNTKTVVFEMKYYDPNGIMVDAAETGWPISDRSNEQD
ncbi:VOC family protein [Parahaliea mediterranea]|uniref:VOC family protein n=1 Tax=Parahaliea mediterranea TaxID=651086 RepID=UPI000E2ED772|nr:VOC family protein [Parahaliea mediterranea]